MGNLGTLVGVDVAGTLGILVGSDVGRTADDVSRLLNMSLICLRALRLFISLGRIIGVESVCRRSWARCLVAATMVIFASAYGIFKL